MDIYEEYFGGTESTSNSVPSAKTVNVLRYVCTYVHMYADVVMPKCKVHVSSASVCPLPEILMM